MTTEINISERIRSGDKTAFENLFKAHYKEMCAYACRYDIDLETAEEIVQDFFCNLWSKHDNLKITGSIRAYLFQSIRNYSLNYIKHQKIKNTYQEYNKEIISRRENEVNDHLEGEELQSRIQHAIDELPPERKKVFLMSRFEELKYAEIAKKLEISVKTVETQMSKALKHLKSRLADYLPLLSLTLVKFFENFLN